MKILAVSRLPSTPPIAAIIPHAFVEVQFIRHDDHFFATLTAISFLSVLLSSPCRSIPFFGEELVMDRSSWFCRRLRTIHAQVLTG
jgi:hypothetical protein